MAFPTIPTVAASRVLTAVQANTTAARTFPSLSGLTKNSGDLLIAICVAYQSSASAGAVFGTWGGSFTEFLDVGGTTSNMSIGAAYKWSTGSETGTFTVTQAATITGHAALILLSIPGAHASTPPEGGTIVNGTGAAANIAALNPSGWDVEDALWIAVAGSGETSATGSYTGIASAPTNYTNYAETGISSDAIGGVEGAVAFRQLAAASDDPATFSVDVSNARNSALLIAVRPAALPVISQAQYRFRNDDGNETTASWKAAVNTVAGTINAATRFRLRVTIDETGAAADPAAATYKLQAQIGAGAWEDVNSSATICRPDASGNLTDGAATTQQLSSGLGTFVAGSFDEVDGAAASVDLASGGVTELEWSLALYDNPAISAGDTINFRVVTTAGGLLDTYAQTPSLTVGQVDRKARVHYAQLEVPEAPGLAAVGAQVGLPYAMTGAVGAQRALPYKLNAEIGSQRALPYLVKKEVGSQRAIPYAVYKEVGSQRALPYAVIAAVGSQRALVYKVFKEVGAQRAIPYVVIAAVGSQRAIPYAVFKEIGAQRALPFGIGGTAGAQRALAYAILNAVGSQRAIPYAVLNVIGAQRAIPYGVRAEIGGQRALPYAVIAVVGSQRALPYGVIAAVGSARALPYAVIAAVGASRAFPYAITVVVGSQRALPFDIAGSAVAVGSQRALPYGIAALAGSQRALPFAILNGVGSQRAIPYNVLVVVGSQRAIPYLVNVVVGAQRALLYLVRTEVGSQRGLPFKVIAPVGSQRALAYAVMAATGSSRSLPYLVAALAGSQRSLPFTLFAAAGAQRSLPYSVIAEVGASRSLGYAILAAPQHLRPDADLATGTWTVTPLYPKIDELIVPDDVDFITSASNPAADTARLSLTNGGDPSLSTGHVLRFRIQKNTAGGDAATLTVRIKQGSTTIKEVVQTVPDTWTTYEATLSGAEADAITDYSALEVELVAD